MSRFFKEGKSYGEEVQHGELKIVGTHKQECDRLYKTHGY